MAPQTYTEATLPPVLRISFDQWSDIAAQERDLHIPAEYLGFRAGLECVNDYLVGPRAIQLPDFPWGGWLYYAERVGQDIIVAQGALGLGNQALLIRKGIIRRMAAIQMPRSFKLNSNAWGVWSKLSAVRTAELAVLTLRERRTRPGPKSKADAWLRRQLEGLGETR